jgi:anti-sigma factor RsiW
MALWSRKLEGDLDALDCAEMERHLSTCPACDSACVALKTALLACRNEVAPEVSPEAMDQVRWALRHWLELHQRR